MTASMVAATIVTYALLARTCSGPRSPRLMFSLTCGLIAAGVTGFLSLL